jgi:hypothetical protein
VVQAELRCDQFHFATDRGRAGYEKYRRGFAKLIWQIASPKWEFDDVNRSAAAFDNPDHVDVVIHNYRWRLRCGRGEIRRAGEGVSTSGFRSPPLNADRHQPGATVRCRVVGLL